VVGWVGCNWTRFTLPAELFFLSCRFDLWSLRSDDALSSAYRQIISNNLLLSYNPLMSDTLLLSYIQLMSDTPLLS
jgi:hypothetical protein